MGLSIITPHYNDLEGLKKIYSCLFDQTQDDWEWIIIDDFSTQDIITDTKKWYRSFKDERIQLILNTSKTNASVCRNLGIDNSHNENLVFLDADDYITSNFVANRRMSVDEFTIYINYKVVSHNNDTVSVKADITNPLNDFLNANFIWQTTSILWNKQFLIKIGKFDSKLERLQDVELSIRALFLGKAYRFIDNEVDFYYHTKPIRTRVDIVRLSCTSVNYLIVKIDNEYNLSLHQKSLIKSYYYACVKNLHRSKNRNEVVFVRRSLNLFYQKKQINFFHNIVGNLLLNLFKYQLISDALFLKLNRYFFK